MSPTIVYDAKGRPIFTLGAAGGKTISRWRITPSGGESVLQYRTTGSWVSKLRIYGYGQLGGPTAQGPGSDGRLEDGGHPPTVPLIVSARYMTFK